MTTCKRSLYKEIDVDFAISTGWILITRTIKDSLSLALIVLLIVKRREAKLQGTERLAPSELEGISRTLRGYPL